MFDMGFTEMMLIGIVALVVIGPERLPAVARTVGKYFGRLKRFMTSVRADVENELRADELREILARQQDELLSLKKAVDSVGQEVESSVSELNRSVEESVVDTSEIETLNDPTDSLASPLAGEPATAGEEAGPGDAAPASKPEPKSRGTRKKAAKSKVRKKTDK